MNRGMSVLLLLGLFLMEATTARAFEFSPNDAWNLSAEVGVLQNDDTNRITYQIKTEVPAFGLLRFLSFIPGFAFDLGIGMDKGLFFQAAPSIRMRLVKPLEVKVGAGGGYSFEYSPYVPVIAGINIFIRKNLCLTANMSYFAAGKDEIKGSLRVTGGIAIAGRYEN